MRSLPAPAFVAAEPALSAALAPIARVRRQPFAERLRLGLKLVDQACAALPRSRVAARALASAALTRVHPTAAEERRPAARFLLAIAADVAATAYCIEAEAWLLEGRPARAEAPAAMARLLALHGSGDPLVFGAVASMLGLRAWLGGDLGRSLRHLGVAALHFADAGDPHRAGEVRVRAEVVLEQAGPFVNHPPHQGI